MKGQCLRGLLGPLWVTLLALTWAEAAWSLGQLDPKVFGYANDTSSSRIVNTGADFIATLSDVTVSTLILNDTIILSSNVVKGTVVIRSRAVQIIAGGCVSCVIDFGGLVSAIYVSSDGTLGFYNVTTRNPGPRNVRRLPTQPKYSVRNFGAWPSIVLAPDATVTSVLLTVYDYSEPHWQQCTLFQNFTENEIRAVGYSGTFTDMGRNALTANDDFYARFPVVDVKTNLTVGTAVLFAQRLTIICVPDPFVNFYADQPAEGNTSSGPGGVPWWVGLLAAVGALLVVVLGAWICLFARSRRPHTTDSEKAVPAEDKGTPPEADVPRVCQRCSEDFGAEEARDGHRRSCDGQRRSCDGQRRSCDGHRRSCDGHRRSSCDGPARGNATHVDPSINGGKHNHAAGSNSTAELSNPDDSILSAPTTGPSSTNTNSITDMSSLPDILRARSAMLVGSLELGAPLGRGSYGKVYKGKWKGVTVAVKIVEHGSEAKGGIRQLRESILSSSIIHPNVVSTYKIRTIPAACAHPDADPRDKQGRDIGAYASDPTLEKEGGKEAGYGPDMLETWLLLEFCDRGNLDRAIMQQKAFILPNGKPNLESMYRCLIDMAAGMDYLHSLGVINGDLKPANVLLKSTIADSRGFTCKLADFGLSRVLDTYGTHVSTQTYGTLAYQPAELLREGKLTKAVDVYSFGMIMWELYTGRRLFENNITGQVFYKVLMGFRPGIPTNMEKGYKEVMEACWQPTDAARPTFEVILKCLQKLLDEHMRLMYGMDHVPTIQMAFSDNQDANGKIAKVPSNGDSAAFFNQLQAAARQARDELSRPQALNSGHSLGIKPILEGSGETTPQDGPASADSYVQINSLGGTLHKPTHFAVEAQMQARMNSWDRANCDMLTANRANSGSLTPHRAGSGSLTPGRANSGSLTPPPVCSEQPLAQRRRSSIEGHVGMSRMGSGIATAWQPGADHKFADISLSPFNAAVRARDEPAAPAATAQPAPAAAPGASAFAALASIFPVEERPFGGNLSAEAPMGLEELRPKRRRPVLPAAHGELYAHAGAQPAAAVTKSAGENGGQMDQSTDVPTGHADMASQLGRKPWQPCVELPLSPPSQQREAAAALKIGGASNGNAPAAAAAAEREAPRAPRQPVAASQPIAAPQPLGLADVRQSQGAQQLASIPPGSLAEHYLQLLCKEEEGFAGDAPDAAPEALLQRRLPPQHSSRSTGSELLSEPGSTWSAQRSVGGVSSSGQRSSGSVSGGRWRPGLEPTRSDGQSNRGSTSTSSEIRDERIIAEEQRDAPDGVPDLDDLLARRRPWQGIASSQAAAGEAQTGAAGAGRPPSGQLQSQLLQDAVGGRGIALRHSPFGGFTAVQEGGAIEGVGRPISMTGARSGPADSLSRTEVERKGRNGGPTVGFAVPQKASLHIIRRDGGAGGGGGGGEAPIGGSRFWSLPPADLALGTELRAKSKRDTALSLGAAPLSRQIIARLSGEDADLVGDDDSSIAKVPGQIPASASPAAAAAQHNPFAFDD